MASVFEGQPRPNKAFSNQNKGHLGSWYIYDSDYATRFSRIFLGWFVELAKVQTALNLSKEDQVLPVMRGICVDGKGYTPEKWHGSQKLLACRCFSFSNGGIFGLHVSFRGSSILLMVQKSCVHQLALVVYLPLFTTGCLHHRWLVGFLNRRHKGDDIYQPRVACTVVKERSHISPIGRGTWSCQLPLF